MEAAQKRVFVTGGNAGIGQALCKQLASEDGCYVYMGSRSLERGAEAIKTIVSQAPSAEGKIEVIQVDVADPASITTAAAALKEKLGDQKLYALVNNAGTGLKHNVTEDQMIQTNVYGPKNMSEALIPLIDPEAGRIVNVGSGGGGMHVSKMDEAAQKLLAFDSANTTWPQLEEYIKNYVANGDKNQAMGGYGMTKAVLHVYTQIQAKENPKLKISAISPGFIDTALTAGYGAKLTPEEGTVSIRHCLFKELGGSGWYYGSDGVRSPLHFMRNPGEPAFEGY